MKIFIVTIIFIGFDLVVALRSKTEGEIIEPKLSPRSNRRSRYHEVEDNPGNCGFFVTKQKSTRELNPKLPRASKAIAPPDVSVEQSDFGVNYISENETFPRNQDSVEPLKTGVNNPRAIKPRKSSPATKKKPVSQILQTRSTKVVGRRKKEEGGRNPYRRKNRFRNESKTFSKYRARIYGRKKKSSKFSELKIVPGKGWTASYRYSGRGSNGEDESKRHVSRNLHYNVNRRGASSGRKRDGKTIKKIARRIFRKKNGSLRFCGNDK